jgi:hypothetical protein
MIEGNRVKVPPVLAKHYRELNNIAEGPVQQVIQQ